MKFYLITLLLLLSNFVYSQIDYNFYIGLTKKEIINTFKSDDFKYTFEQKMSVDIDTNGKWTVSDSLYTWLVYYSDIKALFTFDKKGRCIKYYLLCRNLDKYWDYFDYYNDVLSRSNDLTWIEKRHKYYMTIKLKALIQKQFIIFAEKKNY